jgi:hypothetical protein
MYICGSCRGAAVTIMEPGLVGVWQWAPLNDLSFYYLLVWVGGVDIYMMPFIGEFICSFIKEYMCMIDVGDLFMIKVLINCFGFTDDFPLCLVLGLNSS